MSKAFWTPSGKPPKSKKSRRTARKRARARLLAAGRYVGNPFEIDALIEADPSLALPFDGGKKPPKVKRTKGHDYKAFYKSAAWKIARYACLEAHGGRCLACGVSAKEGAIINVDHIVPISKAWERRLDPDNLQPLCGSCNQGKGARFSTDWRPKPVTLIPRAPTDDEIHRGNPFLH